MQPLAPHNVSRVTSSPAPAAKACSPCKVPNQCARQHETTRDPGVRTPRCAWAPAPRPAVAGWPRHTALLNRGCSTKRMRRMRRQLKHRSRQGRNQAQESGIALGQPYGRTQAAQWTDLQVVAIGSGPHLPLSGVRPGSRVASNSGAPVLRIRGSFSSSPLQPQAALLIRVWSCQKRTLRTWLATAWPCAGSCSK